MMSRQREQPRIGQSSLSMPGASNLSPLGGPTRLNTRSHKASWPWSLIRNATWTRAYRNLPLSSDDIGSKSGTDNKPLHECS